MEETGFKAMFGAPFSQNNFIIVGTDDLCIHHTQAFGAETLGML
jgi:hypothetical protein